ncbi:MAG: TniQ family protein, partial [Flavobacteriaceae bacterium]|nr:TniQ family protein [Flavobacteriaceae bacterium]
MKNKHSTMNNAWLIEDDYIDKYVSQLNNIPRLYLQYLPEESLNSWVIRNSILNQITPKAIIRHFFPQKRSCDLDFILEYHKWVNVLNVFNNKQEYENVEPAMAI